MTGLKDIKPVAKLGGQPLYSAEQMQEYAKECVREAIILNSGGAVSDDMIKRAIDSVFTEDTKND
ncbi:hypothetical protein [Lactococcus petauri]|uniref:Uncharacterized protein n=1 Tax=Lactococcus petauri TaxID=1940789 RepID=A0AAJ2IUJ3_9LACT|nr:hypothetical protein [Lactococcus petauri]MDT2526401.1 hypothetical protein [Lactococcus petauri]MDT2540946.1 hypothetical protein [Lactococcus petauri]MDT2557520.1 hypothetical protein [Lactococcus petauri]MDT2559405.1 hypothetical protein [Lactococcus petauri]MDT2567978.1 hypothetical protein [Lactococcus petauri]